MRLGNLSCGSLYRLRFRNGKSYIGVCGRKNGDPVYNAFTRYRGHRKAAEDGSQCAVHRAWRKYGAPKMTVLAVLSATELLPTEQRAIAVFNTMTPGGYNMTPGGEVSPTTIPEIAKRVGRPGNKNSLGYRHTEETKALLSRLSTGRKLPPLTEDTKKKISASLLGNQHLRGHIHSEETRLSMSLASKGKPKTLAHRVNMSLGMLGVKHPNATGDKHHLYGVKRPVTMCAKISSYKAFVAASKLGTPFSAIPYERRP